MRIDWQELLINEITNYKIARNCLLNVLNDDHNLELLNQSIDDSDNSFALLKEQTNDLLKEIDKLIENSTDDKVSSALKNKKKYIKQEIKKFEGSNLLLFMDEKEASGLKTDIKNNESALVTFDKTFCSNYPSIATILFFSGSINKNCFIGDPTAFMEYCTPGPLFAEKCNDEFVNLMVSCYPKPNAPLFNDFFASDVSLNIIKSNDGDLLINNKKPSNVILISDVFFEKIERLINENKAKSIIDISLLIRKENGCEIQRNLIDFKELYELTDSQILVSNQKYLEGKRVERESIERTRFEREERKRIAAEREDEERRRWMEEGIREREALDREYEMRRMEEDNERQRRELERQHEEQLRVDRERNRLIKQQAISNLDAQIASLRREAYSLNGPNDSRRRQAVEQEIATLEREKLKYK